MPNTTQPEQPRKKKRRIRPLWIMIGSPVIIVLLLMVAAGGHRLYVQRQIEQELREIAARGQPVDADDLQADYALPAGANDRTVEWTYVFETMDAVVDDATYNNLLVNDNGEKEPLPLPGEDWPNEPVIAKLMIQLEPVFAKLDELRENPGEVRFPLDFSEGYLMLIPHVQQARNVARMLALRARWQVYHGKTELALESLLTIRQVGDTLDDDKIIVSQIVRIACYLIMINETLELLPHANWSDKQLTRLQEEFLNGNEFQATLKHMLEGERALVLDVFNNPKPFFESVGSELPPGYMYVRLADQLYYLQLSERLLAASELPDAQGQAKYQAIELEIEEQSDSQWQQKLHALTLYLLPSASSMREVVTQAKAYDRAATTLIACQRYHLANGSYPTKLEQLVPQYLDSVPSDPYDNQPLRYLVKPEEIIVYSVGKDLVDDGGESSEDSEFTSPDLTRRLKIIDE